MNQIVRQKSFTSRSWAELGLLGLIWGATFLTVHLVLEEVSVVTSVWHRTTWAALFLWVYIAIRRVPVPGGWRVWGGCAVMGLLNNLLPFGLMAWGQLTIESGLTAILNATTAIFGVAVAGVLFVDEKLSFFKVLGVALGLGGVAVTIGPKALSGFDPRALAQLAVLAGTLSYALAGAWARVHLSALRPEVAAAGMLSAASVMVLPIMLALDGPPRFDLSITTWGAIGYLAIIATALAYLLYYRILAVAGAGNLLVVTLIIPPIAVVLGALVLGESLPLRSFGGFALLTLGLWTLNRRPHAAS